MEKKTFTQKLQNMPIPLVATMLSAATLGNVYSGMGYTVVRHISMWASTVVLLCYFAKIILHFGVVKKEYSNTVPASLYAGITMVTMILSSYYATWFPAVCKVILAAAVCVHAVHILVFIYRNVLKGVKMETFVPSWFVTFNGIMVSTAVGAAMLPPLMARMVVWWGIGIYTVTIPFMVYRLMTKEVKDAFYHTQAIVLAPCSLCVVGYINVIKNPNAVILGILYVCVLLSLLFIIVKLPKFFSYSFVPGFAGLTFPMAIGVVASTKMAGYLAGQDSSLAGAVTQIAGIQIYLTTAIVGYVLLQFFIMFKNSFK